MMTVLVSESEVAASSVAVTFAVQLELGLAIN